MKANKKSFQKRLLNGKGFDLKAAGKFLIFCMFFSTMLAVSNPVNASTANEPFSISLGKSDANPGSAASGSNFTMMDLPTTTPVEATDVATETTFTETPSFTDTPKAFISTATPTIIVEMPTSTLTDTAVPTISDATPTPAEPSPTITPTIDLTPGLLTAAGLTEYYVSKTGSDSNPGTLSQPLKTIQRAVNSVVPGGTVFIMEGTYNESVNITTSGTSTNPIKLTNYNGQS